MSPDRWKRHEREVARLLGGRRLPNNGAGQPQALATKACGTVSASARLASRSRTHQKARMFEVVRKGTDNSQLVL